MCDEAIASSFQEMGPDTSLLPQPLKTMYICMPVNIRIWGRQDRPKIVRREHQIQTLLKEPAISDINRKHFTKMIETAQKKNDLKKSQSTVKITTTIIVRENSSNRELRVCKLIDKICKEMNFKHVSLIKSMVYCESGFDKNSVSSCNAQGLMQITPRWFGESMAKYGVTDLCADEAGNLRIGIEWIQHLLEKYDGDAHKALVAYNCGESEVDEKGRTYSSYSYKVLKIAGDYACP